MRFIWNDASIPSIFFFVNHTVNTVLNTVLNLVGGLLKYVYSSLHWQST
jgi:hypothetical protein